MTSPWYLHQRSFVCSLAITALLLVCSGCVSMQYIVDGNLYSSLDEANAKWNELMVSVRQGVTRLPEPLLDRGLVALPSDKEIVSGRFLAGSSAMLSPEAKDFLIRTTREWLTLMAEAIQMRGIFRELAIKYYDDPETARAGNTDYLIICDVDGWSIKNTSTGVRKKILLDQSKKAVARTFSFLGTLETAAREFCKAGNDQGI